MENNNKSKMAALQCKTEATGYQHTQTTIGMNQPVASRVTGAVSGWTYHRRDRLLENSERKLRRAYGARGLRLRKSPARRAHVAGFGLYGLWATDGRPLHKNGCPFHLSLESAVRILETLPTQQPARVPFVQKLTNFCARFMR